MFLVKGPRQHIQYLIALIQKDNIAGYLPIVIGELNEDFSDDEKDGIKILTSSCNLVNTFQAIIGSTLYSRNKNRKLFQILIKPHIIKFVNRIVTLDETSGFSSDHIPLFIYLNRNIFTYKLISLLPPPLYTLKSTNKARFHKYINENLPEI